MSLGGHDSSVLTTCRKLARPQTENKKSQSEHIGNRIRKSGLSLISCLENFMETQGLQMELYEKL